MRQSSLNKCERMDRVEASRAMFWTSLRAGFAYHLALFVFEEGYLAYLWIRSVLRWNRGELEERPRRGKSDAVTVQSFTKKTVRNLLLCVFGMVAEAVGASVGTYIYPGYGTLACDRLFGTCVYMLWRVC